MTTAERRAAFAAALVFYLAFVAYQSLAGGAPRPCTPPLGAVGAPISRGDGLANLVAYVPLGLLVAALASRRNVFALRLLGWLAISAFSLSMELLQACLSGRVSSWYDWATNSAGALLGLLGLPLVERLLASRAAAGASSAPASPTARPALLFIGTWLAVCTVPWRFTLDVGTVRANLSFLRRIGTTIPDPWLVAQHAFAWIAVGFALRAVVCVRAAYSRRLALVLVLVLVLALGAQVLLVHGALSLAELAGAAVGVGICLLVAPRMDDARLARWLPAFAMLSVAAYELAPRKGAWMHVPFSWWPLLGQGSLVGALGYALFFCWLAFGLVLSLRWSAHAAAHAGGEVAVTRTAPSRVRRYALPAATICALFAMEYAQPWIAGRIGDTSPPIVTALAFIVAWVLTERIKDRDRATWRRCAGSATRR